MVNVGRGLDAIQKGSPRVKQLKQGKTAGSTKKFGHAQLGGNTILGSSGEPLVPPDLKVTRHIRNGKDINKPDGDDNDT